MNDKLLAINKALTGRLLYHALQLMKPVIAELGNTYLSDRCQSIEQNYRYLTDYFLSGNNDPERNRIFLQLTEEAFLLSDDIQVLYEAQHESAQLTALKASWAALQTSANYFDQLKDVFYRFCLADNLPDAEEQMRDYANRTDSNYLRMAISGLTVSMLRRFSRQGILLLCRLVTELEGDALQRALVGLALLLLKYNDRLPFFADIQTELTRLTQHADIRKYWQETIRFLIETTLTEQTQHVMRQIQQDLMPKLGNQQGPIVINIEDAEEGNPLWSQELNNTLSKHMNEMTRLHEEGADFTYTSTREILHTDFFRKDMANWFLPFAWEHPQIDIQPDSKELTFVRGLIAANIEACDIDRYATCLLYKHIGDNLQNMTLPDAMQDIEQFGKVASAEPVTPLTMAHDQVRTFYRFFYHNPWQVENIIPASIQNLCRSVFFDAVVTSADDRLRFADKCLNIRLYPQAEYLYSHAANTTDAQTLQKWGYALQKQEKYAEAVEVLERSLLLSDDEWTLHHIAACLRKSGKNKEALPYYDRLLEKQPDKQSYLQAKAKCLMDMQHYQEALQLFFKLDILYPNDTNIGRGLAWCAFMTGKHEYAERYFEQNAYADNATANDWLNYGHLLFVQQQRQDALNAYRKSRELSDNLQQFFRAFRQDRPALLSKGLTQEEISLMEDVMLSSFRSTLPDRHQ